MPESEDSTPVDAGSETNNEEAASTGDNQARRLQFNDVGNTSELDAFAVTRNKGNEDSRESGYLC